VEILTVDAYPEMDLCQYFLGEASNKFFTKEKSI
jgi:hypothetical protein